MDVMADLAASNEVNTELVAVSTDSIPVHRWQSQLGMAMRIYLPTYVGYSAIYAPHISDRHPIRIRMAIPNRCGYHSNKHVAQRTPEA